jgi:hypothetical protein
MLLTSNEQRGISGYMAIWISWFPTINDLVIGVWKPHETSRNNMSSSFDGYSTLGPKKGRLKSPRNHRSKRAMSIANGDLNYQMNRMILRAKARNISTDGLCPIGYNVRKWMIDAAVLPLRIRRSERGRERKGARDKKDVSMHQYVYCVYIYILYIIYTWERERKRERESDFIQKKAFIWPDYDNLPRVAKDFDKQWTWHMQWDIITTSNGSSWVHLPLSRSLRCPPYTQFDDTASCQRPR